MLVGSNQGPQLVELHRWLLAPAYPARVATLAEELGEFVAGFGLEGDPQSEALTRAAQMHILDALGVGLAATTFADATPHALLALASASGASTDSTLFGLKRAPRYRSPHS